MATSWLLKDSNNILCSNGGWGTPFCPTTDLNNDGEQQQWQRLMRQGNQGSQDWEFWY